jgi:hypothetical protein
MRSSENVANLKYRGKQSRNLGVAGSDVAATGSRVEGVASCAVEFILYIKKLLQHYTSFHLLGKYT